jgi:hypothetical protein
MLVDQLVPKPMVAMADQAAEDLLRGNQILITQVEMETHHL